MNQRKTESLRIVISGTVFKRLTLLTGLMVISYSVRSQLRVMDFGYRSVGDSIEFIFGQQKTIVIGREVIILKDRFNEIKVVNVAGD